MNKIYKDGLIVGFAVFAIFFGAGNLIFPPQIGLVSGQAYIPAIIGLTLTGILLPIVSVVAVSKMGGSFLDISKPVAPWFYTVFNLFAMGLACFITIPRTGGVAFETGFSGVFPEAPSIAKYIFLIAFFALNFYFANDKSNVIDKVGKLLTPILLIILVLIVILAVVKPVGDPVDTQISNSFTNAFITAYQTGDLVTGLLCATIFVQGIKSKGYTEENDVRKMTLISVAVAFIGLFVVYGGLLYLGATGNSYFPSDIDQTSLLIGLVRMLSGNIGVTALSIAVAVACLTTAVGITATVSDFVCNLSKNKIPFRLCVLVVSVIGVFMASGGVAKIISLSGPIFMLLYPVSITLTLLGLFNKFVPNHGAWKGAVLASTLVGLYDSVTILIALGFVNINMASLDSFMMSIPLAKAGFGWIVPTIIGFVIGSIIGNFKKNENKKAKVS